MDAVIWMSLPLFVAAGSALLCYFVMQHEHPQYRHRGPIVNVQVAGADGRGQRSLQPGRGLRTYFATTLSSTVARSKSPCGVRILVLELMVLPSSDSFMLIFNVIS